MIPLIVACIVWNHEFKNPGINAFLFVGTKFRFRARLCELQKGCTRLAAACDKVYQLLPHGRWFSPCIPAFSTTNKYTLKRLIKEEFEDTKMGNQNP
jgi:hypothetical protein